MASGTPRSQRSGRGIWDWPPINTHPTVQTPCQYQVRGTADGESVSIAETIFERRPHGRPQVPSPSTTDVGLHLVSSPPTIA